MFFLLRILAQVKNTKVSVLKMTTSKTTMTAVGAVKTVAADSLAILDALAAEETASAQADVA
jgi:hypothetical protein